MLMHADYFDDGQSVLSVYSKYYTFENPGKMLVTPDEFFNTSKTKVRNPVISKLFVKIGYGERAGSGGETIKDNSLEMQNEKPEIVSNDSLTTLKVWCVDYATSISGNSITDRQRLIIKALSKSKTFTMTNKEIQQATNLTRRTATEALHELEKLKLIEIRGKGRGTRYALPYSDERFISQVELMPDMLRNMLHNGQKYDS